jgi:succinate dehydrogenase hydrophobic anchor subunit
VTHALDTARAYREAAFARRQADQWLLVAVFAVCLAVVAGTMALVFRMQRDAAVECVKQ